jgi:hypothetical protein
MTNGSTGNPQNNSAAGETQAAAGDASRLNEDLLIALERQKEINTLMQQQLMMSGQLNDSYQKGLNLQTNILAQIKQTVQKAKEKGALEVGDRAGFINKMLKSAEEMDLVGPLKNELEKLTTEFATNAKMGPEEFIKGIDRIRAKAEDVENFSQQIEGSFSSVAQSIGMGTSLASTGIGKFAKNLSSLSVGLTTMKLNAVSQALGQFALQILANAVDQAIKLAFELNALDNQFQASTGYVHSFEESFKVLHADMYMSGVAAADLSKAFGALSSNLSSFNPQADALNQKLVKQVALMEKIGIGANESVKAMNMFERSLNMSSESASNMVLQLATMGQNVGIETKKMMSDINSVMPNLLQFGSRTNQVFTDLAARAKATGIEMSKLVAIAEKFESFDDAADNTAKLNAMLGTNISTMEILTADYDEKLGILRNQIGASVGDLSQMDRFTQKFVQQALGVGSVAEAQALLNMSNQEYLSYNNDMQAQAKTQAELQQQTKDLVIPMEKLKLAFTKLVLVFLPFAEAIVNVVDGLSALPGPTMEILLSLPIISVLIRKLDFDFKSLNFTLSGTILPLALFFAGISLIMSGNEDMQTLGGVLIVVALGMTALQFAAGKAGWKLGIFYAMLVSIAAILGMRINPIFINAFFHLALGLRFMISAMNTAQPQMLIFAAAFLLISVGLAVVIYAFKELLSVAFQFFELAINNHDKLFMVAGGIAAIALAINFLSISMLAGLTIAVIYFGTLGLLIASMMATGFGGGLTFSMGELTTFANAMQMIGAGMISYVQGLEKIASVTSQVKASIGNGLFAATVEGGKTSVVMAGEGTLKAISASKIEVDVRIPEIKVPQTIVHVYVDGKEVSKKVKEEFNEQ